MEILLGEFGRGMGEVLRNISLAKLEAFLMVEPTSVIHS